MVLDLHLRQLRAEEELSLCKLEMANLCQSYFTQHTDIQAKINAPIEEMQPYTDMYRKGWMALHHAKLLEIEKMYVMFNKLFVPYGVQIEELNFEFTSTNTEIHDDLNEDNLDGEELEYFLEIALPSDSDCDSDDDNFEP